jgi:hypothetical protein
MSGIRVFVAVDVCDVRVVWCKELFTAGPLDTILTTGGTAQCGADALLQAVDKCRDESKLFSRAMANGVSAN